MRYTGSANRISWYIGIPIVLCSYVSYLVFDNIISYQDSYRKSENSAKNRRAIIRQHKDNVGFDSSIDSIILGGSNAAFSLSAEKLTHDTGEKWYNLTLLNEGFSDQAYLEYLRGMRKSISHYPIKRIIYSPIYQFRIGKVKKRSEDTPIDGRKDVSINLNIKPNKSVLSWINHLLVSGNKSPVQKMPPITYPLPNTYGDFDFSLFKCRDPSAHIKYQREEVSIAAQWIANNLLQFDRIFEPVDVILVLPPEYYGGTYQSDNSIKFDNDLLKEIDGLLSKQKINSKITYIVQPHYPSIKLICDGRHHASLEGREWRTANLLMQLTTHEK